MPISKKKLRIALEGLRFFTSPNYKYEQYCTSPEITTDILFDCQFRDCSISENNVADLGCGPGILSIGSLLLNADFVTGFEIDPNAIKDCLKNIDDMGLNQSRFDVINCDIKTLQIDGDISLKNRFDTVITNPPFGTHPDNNGIDAIFLTTALKMSTHHVYSLHKSSTRQHAKRLGAECEIVAQLVFDLPKSYKKHKFESVDVEVDLIHSYFN